MAKIGVMMSADRADEEMSSHFGKTEWIMVFDTENRVAEFVKNDGLNGRSAIEIASRKGCTHLIFTEIGTGAFGHLMAAGIRGWVAPEHITGKIALQMFDQVALQPAIAATEQSGSHECCCANRTGSEAAACCQS